jgi:hypothetical protein
MMVAAKYEEIYPPDCKQFAYITDHAFNKPQISQMEMKILLTLDFRITAPTAVRFLERM